MGSILVLFEKRIIAPLHNRPLLCTVLKRLAFPFLAKLRLNDSLRQQMEIFNKISLKKGSIFVDVGAYVGAYTIWASKQVGKDGTVIAIEPSPENFKLLVMNTRKQRNVTPINCALWKKDTVLNLYLSHYPSMHSVIPREGPYIKVKAWTLDSLMKYLNVEHIDAVKIDVEGAELEVLEGAEQTLNSLKLALVEVHREKFVKMVTKILKRHGFSVESSDSGLILGVRLRDKTGS